MPFNLEPEIHFTLQNREAQNSYFARFLESEIPLCDRFWACIVSGITGKYGGRSCTSCSPSDIFKSSLTFRPGNLFGEKNVALVSSLLFCFNPASVFISLRACFLVCTEFTALWYLEEERSTLAVLLFGSGCATHSNGVLSCGFVTHRRIKHFISNKIDSLKSTARLLINAGEFTQSSEGFFEANDLQWHYTRFIFPLPIVWILVILYASSRCYPGYSV